MQSTASANPAGQKGIEEKQYSNIKQQIQEGRRLFNSHPQEALAHFNQAIQDIEVLKCTHEYPEAYIFRGLLNEKCGHHTIVQADLTQGLFYDYERKYSEQSGYYSLFDIAGALIKAEEVISKASVAGINAVLAKENLKAGEAKQDQISDATLQLTTISQYVSEKNVDQLAIWHSNSAIQNAQSANFLKMNGVNQTFLSTSYGLFKRALIYCDMAIRLYLFQDNAEQAKQSYSFYEWIIGMLQQIPVSLGEPLSLMKVYNAAELEGFDLVQVKDEPEWKRLNASILHAHKENDVGKQAFSFYRKACLVAAHIERLKSQPEENHDQIVKYSWFAVRFYETAFQLWCLQTKFPELLKVFYNEKMKVVKYLQDIVPDDPRYAAFETQRQQQAQVFALYPENVKMDLVYSALRDSDFESADVLLSGFVNSLGRGASRSPSEYFCRALICAAKQEYAETAENIRLGLLHDTARKFKKTAKIDFTRVAHAWAESAKHHDFGLPASHALHGIMRTHSEKMLATHDKNELIEILRTQIQGISASLLEEKESHATDIPYQIAYLNCEMAVRLLLEGEKENRHLIMILLARKKEFLNKFLARVKKPEDRDLYQAILKADQVLIDKYQKITQKEDEDRAAKNSKSIATGHPSKDPQPYQSQSAKNANQKSSAAGKSHKKTTDVPKSPSKEGNVVTNDKVKQERLEEEIKRQKFLKQIRDEREARLKKENEEEEARRQAHVASVQKKPQVLPIVISASPPPDSAPASAVSMRSSSDGDAGSASETDSARDFATPSPATTQPIISTVPESPKQSKKERIIAELMSEYLRVLEPLDVMPALPATFENEDQKIVYLRKTIQGWRDLHKKAAEHDPKSSGASTAKINRAFDSVIAKRKKERAEPLLVPALPIQKQQPLLGGHQPLPQQPHVAYHSAAGLMNTTPSAFSSVHPMQYVGTPSVIASAPILPPVPVTTSSVSALPQARGNSLSTMSLFASSASQALSLLPLEAFPVEEPRMIRVIRSKGFNGEEISALVGGDGKGFIYRMMS